MNKKNILLIVMFLSVIVLPFVKVDSAVVFYHHDIGNPSTYESFPYSTTDEVFKGESIITGLTHDYLYQYFYIWYIDSVLIDIGNGWETTTGGGSLYLTGDEFDTTVDVSSFAPSEHNTSLYVKIIDDPIHEKTHSHDWTRAEPTVIPEITWIYPAYDMLQYNYTDLETNPDGTIYQVSVELGIDPGTIDNLWMWVNDVSVINWTDSPVTLGTKTHLITIDSDIVYEITFKAQSDGNLNFTTTRHIVGLASGSSIIATLYSYFYSNRAPEFDPFEITNDLGLDNLTIFLDFEDIITVDQTNTVTSVTCNLTYDQLITISDYYQVTGLSMVYDKVQIWGEDYYIDDSGNKYFEFTDESEHIVDSGDYYNTVNNYEEDDMSQQFSSRTIDGTVFTRRNNFTITNPKAEAMQDIVVRIPITWDSDMQVDMDDITITQPDGTLYDYEMTDVVASTSCTIWIRFGTFASGTTYDLIMYYGNAVSASKEDVANTWTGYLQAYHFESDGTDSCSGNTLTNSGADFVSGQIGNGVDFDGSTDYMYRTDTVNGGSDETRTWLWWGNLDTGTPITPCVWSETDSGGTTSYLTVEQNYDTGWAGWYFYTDGGGSDTYQAEGLYGLNTWYGHAISKNSNDIEYYLNGVSKAVDTNGVASGATNNDLYVGKRGDSHASHYFDGTIDELMVYNGVFTDNEIYVMYWSLASDVASWVGEENSDEDWNVGEHFTWTDAYGATGERDADSMTFWDTVAGDWAAVIVAVPAMQIDAPVQNSAYSWEIKVASNDLTHIDAVGFAVLADSGTYFKIGITRWGYCIAGVSTSFASTQGMKTGYTNTDISWTGDWITLNITILTDARVIYFADDVIIRDSYLDDAWQDITDGDCGDVIISVDNYAGEVNGNITIDYFKTTDYGDGRAGSEGVNYAEYSDPSIVVYNGSRYLTAPGTSDAVGIYTGNGGSQWLTYYELGSISFKTRFRTNTDDVLSNTYWSGFKVCADSNTTDDWWYSLQFSNNYPTKISMYLSNHTGSYSEWLFAGSLTVDNVLDGDWHTYEIQVVEDSWVAGFYDDVLVANTTNAIWLDVWNTTDDDNMRVSHFTHNQNGYNSSTLEIDYWCEFNYTYNWWTSNNGWDWVESYDVQGDRTGGSMIIWDAVASSEAGVNALDEYLDQSPYTDSEFYFETALTANKTKTDYNYINMFVSVGGGKYLHVVLYSATNTIRAGVTDGKATGSWFVNTDLSLTFTQNQKYIFRITVGSSWIAYQYSLGGVFVTIRNSTSDYTSYYITPSYVMIVVDNAEGIADATLFIDYFKTGWGEWEDSDATTAGLTYDTTPSDFPLLIGQDYYVNWESTQACRFWATVTTERNLTGSGYSVFNDSSSTIYGTYPATNGTWKMTDTDWSYIVEDNEFTISIRVGDDVGLYTWLNYTLTRDSVAPIVTLNSPENRPESDPYTNLQIIPLDYNITDLNVEKFENDMKWLIIDDEWFTGDDWAMYPKHKPLQFWEDWHTLTIMAMDQAENYGSDSATFYYEERLAKPLELTFTSSIDDEVINAEQYLNTYLNGMPISATTITNLNDLDIMVYDKFGILLCNITDVSYVKTIAIEVPLRPVTFINENEIMCEYQIGLNLSTTTFWILASAEQTYYLYDEDYILVAKAGSTYINETHWYADNTFIQFTVELDMENIGVILNVLDDDPLNDPLVLLVYEKEPDFPNGYIYIYYETSWSNTTIRVFDNDVPLGGNKSGEQWSVWIFDTSDYGFHNITIFVYDGNDIFLEDRFSFNIEDIANYYYTIATSIDADGGILYVTIYTYWGNCTIGVEDNETSLGDNAPEGTSVWYFDEDTYGLHIFNISVFQNGVLWDTIYFSVTLVEPAAEILSFNHYSVQFDADAGHVYLNYETNWGNTTCRVKDNSTWLSTATGEGISIWTFITAVGFHNITIVINSSSIEWFIDVFSFTITLPAQIWSEVLFSFTSSYDGLMINSNEYLEIYLNDGLVDAGTATYLGEFNITIYDLLGQLLWSHINYPYEETIAISLAMRLVNFTNPNTVICYYRVSLGIYEQAFWITQTQTIGYYMLDGNYTLIIEPTSLDADGGYEYIPTTDSFEVTAGMGDIEVTLLTQQITIIYRPITIRSTSLYTSASISEWYLKYYLDGILSMEGATTETANLTIQLVVTDVFGSILYDQSVVYSRYVDIIVPLRSCTFTNKELVSTTMTILQSGSDEHLFFVLGGSARMPVYLADGTYTVIHAPISPDKEEGVLWVPKDYTFTCSLGSQSLNLWLDTFANVPPLFDPFDTNILDWLTNNRWLTIAALGFAAVNLIGLVFAVGVIITRLPKQEEKS